MKKSDPPSNNRKLLYDWFVPPLMGGTIFLVLCLILSAFFSGTSSFKIRILGLSIFGMSIVVGMLRMFLELWKGRRRN